MRAGQHDDARHPALAEGRDRPPAERLREEQGRLGGVVQDPAQTRRYGDLIDAEGRRLTDMVDDGIIRGVFEEHPIPLIFATRSGCTPISYMASMMRSEIAL